MTGAKWKPITECNDKHIRPGGGVDVVGVGCNELPKTTNDLIDEILGKSEYIVRKTSIRWLRLPSKEQ